MAVLQMQRMNLVAMKQNRKAILERLQELGTVEINFRKKKLPGTSKQDTQGMTANFEKQAASCDQALEILDKYAPEKTSLFSSFAGKPVADRADYDDAAANQQEYMRTVSSIIACDKQIAEDTANIQKLENQSESLVPWKQMDIPLNISGTEKTSLFVGTIPEEVTSETVLAGLKTHQPPVDAADVEIFSSDRDATYLSVLCLKSDSAAAEEALREMGFSKPSWMFTRTPEEEQKDIADEIAECRSDIDQTIAGITAMSDERGHIRTVSDYYRMRADKYKVIGELPQTANTFALSGYIPADRAQAVAQEMSDKYGAAVELEELGEKEKPPVLLKNNAFSSSVEGVLESYGLPKKGEIDPTFIMSIFYVVLFGMMLSDAGYGLLIVIGTGVILKKFPNMSKGLRTNIKMFFFCGFSTIFWGVMFGGYFGDLIPVVASTWFGKEIGSLALWFEPLDDPMKLLMVALLFGIIHMFVGMGIKGYMMLKKHDVTGFICDVVSWYLLLVGLILVLLPTNIFASISNMVFVFPSFVQPLAIGMAVVGALIILVMSGRRKKNQIALRLALGAYDIYGITSWLSDILSYSRLLALGLATGVIAQVINQMGTMFGNGIVGTILFIVIFLVGTALNMAINILGAYVHSNRLEFVEFFNKFYEGGGRPFEPFAANTKHVTFSHVSNC